MDKKITVVAVVIIMLVAGTAVAGGYFLMKDKEEAPEPMVYSSLPIMGNANNDDCINQKDIDLMNKIISGEKSLADYPYADANNDNQVNEEDTALVKKLMNKEPTNILVKDQNDKIVEISYPLKNIVTVNADMLTMMILIGAHTKVAGFIASEYEVEQKVVLDTGAVRLDTGRQLTADNWAAFINLDQSLSAQGGIGAVLAMTDESVAAKKADIDNAGIPVLSIKCSAPIDTLDASLLLGVLTGDEEKARAYYEKSHILLDEIKNKTKDISDEEKTKLLSFSMTYYVTRAESAYTKVTILAGGNNITDLPGDGSEKLLSTDAITKYDAAKYFINFKTMDYTKVDVKSVWEGKNVKYLHAGRAYIDGNLIFVNLSMPVPCRVAYVAEILYPDLFEEGYGDRILQEYVDAFLPHLDGTQSDGDFNVKEDMTTIITQRDYDAVKV